jgi:hypothetical protein
MSIPQTEIASYAVSLMLELSSTAIENHTKLTAYF